MKKTFLIVILSTCLNLLGAVSQMREDVKDALENFKRKDPSIQKWIDSSLAYVVYPNVGKGGFFVGGAHGNGLVFEKGRLIGSSSLIQATIGLQFGAQEFSEIVFFETERALENFKRSQFSMSAQVSAVAAAEGAAQKAKYQLGVAVFLLPKLGAMVEASVGGQKLNFEAASNVPKPKK